MKMRNIVWAGVWVAAVSMVGCRMMKGGSGETESRVRITVDPSCLRSIRGVSELRREAYFGICDNGTGFDRRVKEPQRYDELIKTNNITFGRALGLVSGLDRYYQAIREDPARPGFADLGHLKKRLAPLVRVPNEAFVRDMGGRLDVALHGQPNVYPAFMGRYALPAADKKDDPHAFWVPSNVVAAAELACAVLREKYTDFDRPRYYEPVNEPHWAYWADPHFAAWHLIAKDTAHRQVPGVQVGGPCLSVAYYYKQEFRTFKGLQAFIDNTRCELDFYSFHVYDFLRGGTNDFTGRITSGLPLEAVLDLVQNYTVNAYGKEIGVVVSEHGGYGADDLVEKLAKQNFTETGFAWEMKKRSIDDFNMVSSVLANTLVFMDHPQTVLKAVPFILLNGLGWDPSYYASLYVPRDYDPKSEEWLPTEKILFYRLLRDLKGHRVAAACADPDIQTRAFVDGDTLFVVLNNLSDRAKEIALVLPRAQAMTLRRFGRNADFTPYLTEEPLAKADRLALRGREALVLKARYGQPLEPRRAVDEVPCYGDRIASSVTHATGFVVMVPKADELRYATLRIGISRPPDAGREVALSLNGHPLSVPLEQCAERLVEQEYATCKLVELPLEAVRETNTVCVFFPDGKKGAVGAVVIRAGYAKSLAERN
jgi:hypothetical protein